MSYSWTSVGQIVGRVIRRTGLKDTSLIPDINEWIAECMEMMQLTLTLEHTFELGVKSVFHKAKKPCGMAELYAIEYCGYRLPYSNTIRDPRVPWVPPVSHDVFDSVFVSGVTKENTPSGNFLYSSEFKKVQQMPWHCGEWYKEDGNYILTSFESGLMSIFYGRVPIDRDGGLMIPTEGDYKEALTWFIASRLSDRGYPMPGRTAQEMDNKFDTHCGRARENITLPSVEKMEATTNQIIQLLPNEDYYNSMFATR